MTKIIESNSDTLLSEKQKKTALSGAGTILKGALKLGEGRALEGAGKAKQAAKKFTAKAIRKRAGQERATKQREAQEIAHQGELLQSEVQARAAGSGAGATDPTVATIQGNIAQETAYRKLSAIFEGEELARGLEDLASLREFEGAVSAEAGRLKRENIKRGVIVSALAANDFSDFFSKFGEDLSSDDDDDEELFFPEE